MISRTLCPGKQLHIEARCSHTRLKERDTYDMAAVRLRLLDEWGNIASYAQLPVHFELSGSLELAGPDWATAEGGMTGCYVKTIGRAGGAELKISVPGLEPVKIGFEVEA